MIEPRSIGRGSADAGLDGALIVDKPSGPTSHDVVARVRRLLGTKRVGHAGTLDPMASGVLVVLVGEATKLAPYLTAQEKRYEARVVFGRSTTTLDALGAVTDETPVPEGLSSELGALAANPRESISTVAPLVTAAIRAERARESQVPPAFSAIQVGGRRSYERARRGEETVLPPRAVSVAALRAIGARPPCELDLELCVSKGYYVRSFARDLGARLGVPAHLGSLRRIASGPFAIQEAVRLEDGAGALRTGIRPLAVVAALGLPTARLTEDGARRARLGQTLDVANFSAEPPTTTAAWMDANGCLVAVGRGASDGVWVVERGFSNNFS